MVVKRFLAVFYPPAEFMVTTRISHGQGERRAAEHKFQTNGKVMVKPGWLAVYGKEAQEDDANLVAVAPGEMVRTESVDVNALKTKPPARYTEATLLQRDGRRGQADRRRRAARGDGREGPGHAGHARGDHRRPDLREVHAPRRPRAGAHAPRPSS